MVCSGARPAMPSNGDASRAGRIHRTGPHRPSRRGLRASLGTARKRFAARLRLPLSAGEGGECRAPPAQACVCGREPGGAGTDGMRMIAALAGIIGRRQHRRHLLPLLVVDGMPPIARTYARLDAALVGEANPAKSIATYLHN